MEDVLVALLLLVLVILVFLCWVSQLLALMNMKDDAFPGRYDKPLWFVVIFMGSLLGAVIFWFWKRGRTGCRSPVHLKAAAVESASAQHQRPAEAARLGVRREGR
jgi:hypothetical protein